MCWSNNILIPIVLKKPLRVYKIGTSTNLGNFISLYRNTMYLKYVTKPTIGIYSMINESLYLGKFIVPKGTIYCVNECNEIVSNQIIYTGQYSNVWRVFDINLKELWREN